MTLFFTTLSKTIGAGILTAAMAVSGWLGVPQQAQDVITGASSELPSTVAVFETTLQSSITADATSMTLVSASYNGGASTLASSTYAFVIDGGTSNEEFVIADCTGTACTNMTRGLDHLTGTTTVTTLKKAHRRGASVKITDGPVLLIHNRLLQGVERFENILKYDSASAGEFTDSQMIINKAYADSLAFSGIPEATETASGFGEIATGAEAAAGTSSGSEARLVLPASLATSSRAAYVTGTSGNKIVVTDTDGKIDSDFISTSTLNMTPVGAITAYSSTTAPHGWLLADGSAVSRTTYASLYSVLGTSYGVGDGSTTFNIPNLTGRTIVMASSTQTATSTTDGTPNTRSTIGYKGGETMHTQTENEVGVHDHPSQFFVSGSGYIPTGGSGTGAAYASVADGGGGTAFNVLDPYIILNYIIKY